MLYTFLTANNENRFICHNFLLSNRSFNRLNEIFNINNLVNDILAYHGAIAV